MAFQAIQTANENGVLTITLNRPDAMNALNGQMCEELAVALKTAEREADVRCVLMTGAGRAFCSGQDLAEIREHYTGDRVTLDFGAHLRKRLNPIASRLRAMEKPIVAAVNGAAAGAGASLALAADMRICAENAYFMMAFIHVGLVPDTGATHTLVQAVGYGRAAQMCMLGERIGAADALAWGLCHRVVSGDELMNAANELAQRLAHMPTRALGLTKRALRNAWAANLDDQLEYEAFVQQTAGATADHREGVTAFLEKRKPAFVGR
ncbi:MAG: enoyl-CoA hydratase/isomerase family protein [Phycisphaerales bacterium]|nr:enoyl-CoA hydratase/isomerase family protein [Phycisphaerales bacterium]